MNRDAIPSSGKARASLGGVYFIALDRVQALTTELYEELFDKNGNPIEDLEKIVSAVMHYRKRVNIEIDMVKSACREVNEIK